MSGAAQLDLLVVAASTDGPRWVRRRRPPLWRRATTPLGPVFVELCCGTAAVSLYALSKGAVGPLTGLMGTHYRMKADPEYRAAVQQFCAEKDAERVARQGGEQLALMETP